MAITWFQLLVFAALWLFREATWGEKGKCKWQEEEKARESTIVPVWPWIVGEMVDWVFLDLQGKAARVYAHHLLRQRADYVVQIWSTCPDAKIKARR